MAAGCALGKRSRAAICYISKRRSNAITANYSIDMVQGKTSYAKYGMAESFCHSSHLEPTGLERFACPPLEIQSAKAKHVTREILGASGTDVTYIYIHLYLNKNRIIKGRKNDSHTQ